MVKILFMKPSATDFLGRLIMLGMTMTSDSSGMGHVAIEMEDGIFYEATLVGIAVGDSEEEEAKQWIENNLVTSIALDIDSDAVEKRIKELVEQDFKLNQHDFLDYALGSRDVKFCTYLITYALGIEDKDILTPIELFRWLYSNMSDDIVVYY